jgi:hypothetical protein
MPQLRDGEAGKHVAQVVEGLDLVALAGGDQAKQDRGGVSAVVGAAEQLVLATDGHAAKGVLGGVRRGHSIASLQV